MTLEERMIELENNVDNLIKHQIEIEEFISRLCKILKIALTGATLLGIAIVLIAINSFL